MCRRVDCSKCGRPTFAGCGAHVEQVLAGVPASERCRCRQDQASSSGSKEQPREPASWLRAFLGK